jgi:hypothetical protein
MAIEQIDEGIIHYKFPRGSMPVLLSGTGGLVIFMLSIMLSTELGKPFDSSLGSSFVLGLPFAVIPMIMTYKCSSTGITLNLTEGTISYARVPWAFWKATPTKTIDLSMVRKVFISDKADVNVNNDGKVSVTRYYHLTLQGPGVSKNFTFASEGERDNLYTVLTSDE